MLLKTVSKFFDAVFFSFIHYKVETGGVQRKL